MAKYTLHLPIYCGAIVGTENTAKRIESCKAAEKDECICAEGRP
jgi:hypothetical protein